MNPEYWLKQTPDKPLFSDLAWSRPENRAAAGKLLIIGGNLHGFAAPAEAYAESLRAGIGVCRVLLPDSVRKIIGGFIENAEFAPSTPSGSFARSALGELAGFAAWADGVLFAGDLGRNSETAVVVEQFLQKYAGPVTLAKDAADYVVMAPRAALSRPDVCLAVSLSQLQRLGTSAGYEQPVVFSMDLIRLTAWLHGFTVRHPLSVIVKHDKYILVAHGGTVSSTQLPQDEEIWQVKAASATAVWWLQNKHKPLEAMTAALYDAYVPNRNTGRERPA